VTYWIGAVVIFVVLALVYAVHARLTRRTVDDYEERLGVSPKKRRSAK
jgi:uncharacterized membrane protein